MGWYTWSHGVEVSASVPLSQSVLYEISKLMAKLFILAWILSWVLSKASSDPVRNVPVMLSIVLLVRWLSQHLEVGFKKPTLLEPPSSPAPAPPLKAPQGAVGRHVAGRGFHSLRWMEIDPNNWRREVDSVLVAEAWEKLAAKIVDEFVCHMWYQQLTPDKEFPHEVQQLLHIAFGKLCKRARRVDWRKVLIGELCAILKLNIRVYRSACQAVNLEALKILRTSGLEEQEVEKLAAHIEKALFHEMKTEGHLHPGMMEPEGHYKTLRSYSEGMLNYLLPFKIPSASSPAMRAVTRELLAACVLRPAMMYFTPYQINKLFLMWFPGESQSPATGGSLSSKRSTEELKEEMVPDKAVSISGESEQLRKCCDQVDDITPLRGRHVRSPSGPAASLDMHVFKSHRRSKSLDGDASTGQGRISPPARFPSDTLPASLTKIEKQQEVLTRTGDLLNNGRVRLSQQGANQETPCSPSKPTQCPSTNGSLIRTGTPGTTPTSISFRTDVEGGSMSQAGSLYAGVPPSPPAVEGPVTWSWLLSNQSMFDGTRPAPHRDASANISPHVSPASVVVRSTTGPITRGVTSEGGVGWTQGTGPSVDKYRSPSAPATVDAAVVSRQTIVGRPIPEDFDGWPEAQVVVGELQGPPSSQYVAYNIRVKDRSREWTVTRRYRNFEMLHKRLKENPSYRDLGLALPSKRLFIHTRDDVFVEKRRQDLHTYVAELLRQKLGRRRPDTSCDIALDMEVLEFLSMHSTVYSHTVEANRGSKTTSFLATISPPPLDVSAVIGAGLQQWRQKAARRALKDKTSGLEGSQAPPSPALSGEDVVRKKLQTPSSRAPVGRLIVNRKDFSPTSFGPSPPLKLPAVDVTARETPRSLPSSIFSPVPAVPPSPGDLLPSSDWWLLDSTGISGPLYELVDTVFRLQETSRGFFRRQVISMVWQTLSFIAGERIDSHILKQLRLLCNAHSIRYLICMLKEALWPGGVFFTATRPPQEPPKTDKIDMATWLDPSAPPANDAGLLAQAVRDKLFGPAPPALVTLIGREAYARGLQDLYDIMQSPTCSMNIGYQVLDCLLLALFPELHPLVAQIHKGTRLRGVDGMGGEG